jgi:hypothetical protein
VSTPEDCQTPSLVRVASGQKLKLSQKIANKVDIEDKDALPVDRK